MMSWMSNVWPEERTSAEVKENEGALQDRRLSLFGHLEVVYVTIGKPAFCLFLSLTGVHFRGELQQVGDVIEQKVKC